MQSAEAGLLSVSLRLFCCNAQGCVQRHRQCVNCPKKADVPVMMPFCRSGASSAWAGASMSMPTAWLFSSGAASAEHGADNLPCERHSHATCRSVDAREPAAQKEHPTCCYCGCCRSSAGRGSVTNDHKQRVLSPKVNLHGSDAVSVYKTFAKEAHCSADGACSEHRLPQQPHRLVLYPHIDRRKACFLPYYAVYQASSVAIVHAYFHRD